MLFFFFFKQKTAYEMRISDWSSDVCSSDLFVYSRNALRDAWHTYRHAMGKREVLVCYGMKANSNLAVLNEFKNLGAGFDIVSGEIGRASCRERVCQYV